MIEFGIPKVRLDGQGPEHITAWLLAGQLINWSRRPLYMPGQALA